MVFAVSDNLLNIILKCTNQEIKRKHNNIHKIEAHNNALDMHELKAFIGLLYYAGWAKKKKKFLNVNIFLLIV